MTQRLEPLMAAGHGFRPSPPPWYVGAERIVGDEHYVAVNADGPFNVALVRVSEGRKGQTAANLRLVRAAPELLEAIQIGLSRADQSLVCLRCGARGEGQESLLERCRDLGPLVRRVVTNYG